MQVFFRRRKGRLWGLFSLFAVFRLAVSAAPSVPRLSQYIAKSWNMESGLPQSTVQAVLQTRDGFLWLGTQEGLVRFDGIKFDVFNKKTAAEFRHNDIRALFEGRDGRLWVGTANGLLSCQNGRFTTHFRNREPAGDFVAALFEDAGGTLWIGTSGGGLHRLKDGSFSTLTTKDGLAADAINTVWVDRNGIGWVGTANGLSRIQGGTVSRLTVKDGLPNDFIVSVRESSEGDLWIATRKGLARFRNGEVKAFTARDGLASEILISLYEDKQGCLWIGTEDRGIIRYAGGEFSSFTPEDGLSDGYVLSMCQDREGLLWVGTYSGGLNRLWQGKFFSLSVRDGLPADEVRTILETRDGSLWLGTREGGLSRMRNGSIVSYSTKDGLLNNTVRALFEDEDGSLWIGTNAGLACFRNGRFKTYSRKDGLAHDYVRCFARDPAGRLWVGTSGGGLHLLENGRFVNYLDKGVPDTFIRALTVGRDGSLWIGSNSGLTRWKDGRTTRYTSENGLPSAAVYVVYEDEEGVLWIGTYGGGLCRLKDGRISRFTIRDGMFDDVVYTILDDGRGDLWMSSNLGIFRVSKKSLDAFAGGAIARLPCLSYGTADGMRSPECNGNAQPSGWKSRAGELWFATVKGAVAITADHIPTNSLAPLVAFKQVSINGRPYDPALEAVAPPGPGSLEFHFAGLSFIAPEKVKFKYWLEGFEKDWVDAGTRREAFYTNLPPRSYCFRVIACNGDGIWNETGASFRFILKPHFYQRKVFLAFVGLGFLLAVFAGHRRRLLGLRRRARELARLVDERTGDLAVANDKLEAANRRLEELANTDALTGLANRRCFMNVLEVEWKRGERLGQPVSLIMADVDRFKLFNDAFGHQEGDRCLVRLAAVMKETVGRAGDLIGRYGGEEFIIILPVTDGEGAVRVAERLRRTIEKTGICDAPGTPGGTITLSFGIATAVPRRDLSAEDLIKASDEALYLAKNEGRNVCRSVEL